MQSLWRKGSPLPPSQGPGKDLLLAFPGMWLLERALTQTASVQVRAWWVALVGAG